MRFDSPRSGLLVGPGFLALALWFVWGPSPAALPDLRGGGATVWGATRPPNREALGDPPLILANGFRRTCSDCHGLLDTPPVAPGPGLRQHSHIELDHGDVVDCRACHQAQERDSLRLKDGTEIPFDQSIRQCAECHQDNFELWRRGAHGRQKERFDLPAGEVRRFTCVECHDPHAPREPLMNPVRPLPGPRTLRQGTASRPLERDR